MQGNTKSLIWGVLLIGIGFLFLGHNLYWFDLRWEQMWPLLMIGGGLMFWIGWVVKRQETGLIMPGTILLIYGLLFQYCAAEGWFWMEYLWPVFLLGPGLGFFLMYLLGTRESGLLVPGFVLTFLSIFFWWGEEGWHYFWPVLLIVVGLYLLLKSRMKNSHEDSTPDSKNLHEVS